MPNRRHAVTWTNDDQGQCGALFRSQWVNSRHIRVISCYVSAIWYVMCLYTTFQDYAGGVFFIIPHASTKLKEGMLVSPCPSVRPSVCPSVHLWTESCLLCIFNNTCWIHFIFAYSTGSIIVVFVYYIFERVLYLWAGMDIYVSVYHTFDWNVIGMYIDKKAAETKFTSPFKSPTSRRQVLHTHCQNLPIMKMTLHHPFAWKGQQSIVADR